MPLSGESHLPIENKT